MPGEPSQRSQQVAAVFDRAAPTYDSVGVPWFTPIAEGLVGELAPAPGERALDVGCGRGAAVFPLAEAVGPTGRVTGIDLAPGMVQALRADVCARGLTTVDVQAGDAMAPDLGGRTVDVLSSSLVLFFLPDPGEALSRWHDLLVPGGRLGVSTFGRRDATWISVDDVFTPFLPPQLLDARTSGTSGPFASDEGVEALLRSAGLQDVRTVHRDVPVRFRDAEQWHAWSWSHGQRSMWEAVPPEHHQQVRSAAAERLEEARDSGGTLTLQQQVRYTLARRPG